MLEIKFPFKACLLFSWCRTQHDLTATVSPSTASLIKYICNGGTSSRLLKLQCPAEVFKAKCTESNQIKIVATVVTYFCAHFKTTVEEVSGNCKIFKKFIYYLVPPTLHTPVLAVVPDIITRWSSGVFMW